MAKFEKTFNIDPEMTAIVDDGCYLKVADELNDGFHLDYINKVSLTLFNTV